MWLLFSTWAGRLCLSRTSYCQTQVGDGHNGQAWSQESWWFSQLTDTWKIPVILLLRDSWKGIKIWVLSWEEMGETEENRSCLDSRHQTGPAECLRSFLKLFLPPLNLVDSLLSVFLGLMSHSFQYLIIDENDDSKSLLLMIPWLFILLSRWVWMWNRGRESLFLLPINALRVHAQSTKYF